MKKIAILFAWISGAIALALVAIGLLLAHRVVLVAQSDIVVDSYPVPDPARNSATGRLKPGEKVQVLSCDDLKSYPAIHVRLKNGNEGYVIDGKFKLEFFSILSNVESSISFSCSS